ncbi:MAG: hypothetical protein AAFN93_07820 [Bacteroidota bacterium]
MTESRIKFDFEARYFKEGVLSKNTKKLIFVLHGHGQLAQYFVKGFTPLVNEGTCIIAPEGLNRYYLSGFTGRVGATWMTKEDRLTDISNYLNFLDSVYNDIKGQLNSDISITILGFSQGAATASRWAATAKFKFKNLILWAGIFPPDMNFEDAASKFEDKSITYVYGTEDQYINEKRILEMNELSKKLNVNPKVIRFRGPHEINQSVFDQLSL